MLVTRLEPMPVNDFTSSLTFLTRFLIFSRVSLKYRARASISSLECIGMVWVRSPSPSAISLSWSATLMIGLLMDRDRNSAARINMAKTTPLIAIVILSIS